MNKRLRRWGRVVVASVVALGALGVWGVAYTQVRTTDSFAVAAKEKIRSESERENVLRGLARLYGETADERALLSSRIIPQDGIAMFIERIESTAKDVGVTLEIGTVVLGPASSESLQTVTLTVHAEGSWNASLRFLRALESLPYGVRITSAAFDGLEKSGLWSDTFSVTALSVK